MKICHMSSAHKSDDDRIFLREAVSAAKAGHKTYIVAPGKTYQKDGVHIAGIGNWKVSRLQRMLIVTRNIYKRALEIDADIYQFHDPELLPMGLKLKKKGKIVIYDSHEDVPRQILSKEWLPLPVRKTISGIFETYEKFVSRRLDCIITATDHIKEIFQKSGATTCVVRNFPILDDIHGENDNYTQRLNVLCYAGGLTKQRGITKLVEVIDNVDAKLLLAGDLEEDYKQVLEKMPGFSKTQWKGYLTRDEIEMLYNESKIGMAVLEKTPNHINSLAIKLFEYMAAGIPIICSDFPLWKEIVEQNGCGICVDPCSTKMIIKAIEKILGNPQLAKQMGDCGKKTVQEKYNWDKEKNILLELYESYIQ